MGKCSVEFAQRALVDLVKVKGARGAEEPPLSLTFARVKQSRSRHLLRQVQCAPLSIKTNPPSGGR